jgi:anaerobic magnesium-protoporphyrin IX monomethyl ester cyclase
MRVLLVNPTAFFEVVGNNPEVIEESRGHNPPLGILLLAAYLERHSSHEVAILDTQAEELSYPEITSRVSAFKPDVVGITAMTLTLVDVLRVMEIVRAAAPSARIVIGGPHAHLFPDETVNLPGVDFVVLGEGEVLFKELLDRIDDRDAPTAIPGLVFHKNGGIVHTGPPAIIQDLDALPFPARHLTDVKRYGSVLSPRQPVTTMFTSRGCPFSCTFCDRPHLGKKFRARSAQNVVDEMEECVRMGIHEFLVYDDTFTIRRDRVVAFCEEILRRGLDVGYDVRARVDTVDPELLQLMARSGCRGLHYGVEAGTEKILKVLHKGIDLEEARRTFEATRKAGMQVLAYFMIGSPGETREDILETFRVARRLDPDYLHMTILTPFPGTAIYRDGLESGVLARDTWREFASVGQLGFIPPHWPENFTLDELQDLLREGYRGFYRRPSYLLKRVLAVRSTGELMRKGKAGLRVLTMKKRPRGLAPWRGGH